MASQTYPTEWQKHSFSDDGSSISAPHHPSSSTPSSQLPSFSHPRPLEGAYDQYSCPPQADGAVQKLPSWSQSNPHQATQQSQNGPSVTLFCSPDQQAAAPPALVPQRNSMSTYDYKAPSDQFCANVLPHPSTQSYCFTNHDFPGTLVLPPVTGRVDVPTNGANATTGFPTPHRQSDGPGPHDDGASHRVVHSGSDDQAQKRKNRRFRLTHAQTRFLAREFSLQPHPDAAQRERLASEIPGLTPRQVQVWFQNRRAKMKRLAQESRDRSITTIRSHHLDGQFEPAPQYHPAPAHYAPAQYGPPQYRTNGANPDLGAIPFQHTGMHSHINQFVP